MMRRRRQGPYVLAADTSTFTQSLAIVAPDRVVASMTLSVPRGHASQLLGAVDSLLSRVGLSMPSMSALAFGLGPGSFTGLRIGLASLKGLAFAYQTPLFGVSSLAALAFNLASIEPGSLICPCIDARKAEVYTCLFRLTAEHTLEALCDEMVILPRRLFEEFLFVAPGDTPIHFLGSGAQEYRSTIEGSLGQRARFSASHLSHPSALYVGFEGLRSFVADAPGLDIESAEPRYIRLSDAELGTRSSITP